MRQSLISFVILAASAAFAEEASTLPRSVFGPGEQTQYEVSFLGVPAGVAQITVGWRMQQFGREVWPLVCVGQTTAVTAAFDIKDRFVSYWDYRQQKTVGADHFTDEGKVRRRERYRYDEADKKVYVTKQKEGGTKVEKVFDAEQAPLDLAAATFSLRNATFETGSVHEFPIFTGAKQYRMRATVEGKQSLTTRLGTLEVWRVSVNGDFSGNLQTRSNMTIYYSADGRQLPVRATADFAVGAVLVEAVSFLPGRAVTGGAL